MRMMNKKAFFIIALLLIITAIPWINPLANNDGEIDLWSLRHTKDNNKVWTIEFSMPLREATVTSRNIYIEDDLYRYALTEVSLSSDKKSMIVTPKLAFEDNRLYHLVISNDVTSEKGEKLAKRIIMPFIVNSDGSIDGDIQDGAAVRSVSINRNQYLTSVTVISGETAARVTANSKDMHYEGNNVYSLGLTDVKQGDTVIIRAYSQDGKRIFSQNYRVN